MHVMTQAHLRHGSGATDLIRSGGRPDLTLRGQWCEGRAFLAHALADACEHRGAVRAHNNARTWLTVTWRSPLLERAQRRHEGAAVPTEYVNSGGRHDLNLRGRWLEGREYPAQRSPPPVNTLMPSGSTLLPDRSFRVSTHTSDGLGGGVLDAASAGRSDIVVNIECEIQPPYDPRAKAAARKLCHP
jgi:hypothetical protein